MSVRRPAHAAFLQERVDAGDLPGACWVLAGPDGILDEGAVGRAVIRPEIVEASTDTIYDLASLTKPLVTSFLFLAIGRRIGLNAADQAWRFLPEIDRLDKRAITLEHLLTHTAGMPAWVPFYLQARDMRGYLKQLRDRPPESRPGSRVVYSCAGYIMLGEILSRAAAAPLDRLAGEAIFEPLGLTSTGFNPPRAWHARVAATEDSCEYEKALARPASDGYTGFRKGIIRSQVHDQNAWVLGGVAGNAGLFSTARETAVLAAEYLGDRVTRARGLLDPASIERARRDMTPGLEEARSYAFRLAARGETAAGPSLPPAAFGHNGFTGTSVWLDPVRCRVYVLLTNRVHPSAGASADMLALRRRFHDLASAL
ncbi:MAG TPA: serine hydrolase domain-containing protein [Candidatus Polarisedimenticolia bacterium]|nr:serine hydrolase domain-containing protein [Candidatus Polarisedimenticolia bacterium]